MDNRFHDENIKFFQHFGISEESGIPNKKVALVLDKDYKDNANSQQAFILGSNLLARLFINIDFIVPEGTLIHHNIHKSRELLDKYILKKAKLIFPEGNFQLYSSKLKFEEYDGVLVIGSINEKSSNIISATSNGWNIYINTENVESDNFNSIGACAASCIGVAELFKYVTSPKGSKLCAQLSFSLLNYSTDIPDDNPKLLSDIDIGKVSLIGAGAIGCAIIYTLNCLVNLKGNLDIVDNDRFSDTNLNKYIIADVTTIGKKKVDIAKKLLNNHSGLKVHKYPIIYDKYKIKNNHIETMITAVDKKITRYNIQNDLPKQIIDASTTDSFIDLARVDFGTGGACLGCLYAPESSDELQYSYIAESTGLGIDRVKFLYNRNEGLSKDDIYIISKKYDTDLSNYIGSPIESLYKHEFCSSSKLLNEETGDIVIAPVSFISALAGVLAVCELIKTKYYPRYRINNHFLIDTLKTPNPLLHNYKKSSEKCPYCNDEVFLTVYMKKWQA